MNRTARVLAPLALPFLTVLAAPRWEMVIVALAWSLLALPGALWLEVLLPAEHPLRALPVRFALASVLSLVPFAIVARIGCALHVRLVPVLAVTAVLHVAAVVGALLVARRGPARRAANMPRRAPFQRATAPELGLSRPRAALAVGGIVALLAAVAFASGAVGAPSALRPTSAWGWALTIAVALAGSIAAGVAFFTRSGPQTAPSRLATKIGWTAALLVTLALMRVAYTLPGTRGQPAWDIDDVSYVAEAVDARHGVPLGAYEPSLGSDAPNPRARLQPLVAPLVATLSRATGLEPAALAHSLLPPLLVLLGACALAAPLLLLFPRRPDAVAVGVAAALVVLAASWTFERSLAEVIVLRAAQGKAIHLAVLAPLQLATLALALLRPRPAHLGIAGAAAIVAHLTHPFATVAGAFWIVGLAAVARTPRSLLALCLLFALHAALAVEVRASERGGAGTASARDPGSPVEMMDLARTADGTPLPRQEPGILFSYDVPFALGAAAVPLLVGLARRRRLAGTLALVAAGALAVCTLAPLGRVAQLALPTPILWRARWLLPALPIAGAIGACLYIALASLGRRRGLAAGAALAIIAAFAVGGAGRLLRPGRAPPFLSKMDADTYALVTALGGVRAQPFVWAPLYMALVLPQLMPHVRLVMTRDKTIWPASPEDVQFIAAAERRLARGKVEPADLPRLAALFPIELVVFDSRAPNRERTAAALTEAGWREAARAGPYEVWREQVAPPVGR